MKRAKYLGNLGMALTLIGLTGLAAAEASWQSFYLFVLVVAMVFLILANVILTDFHKNVNK